MDDLQIKVGLIAQEVHQAIDELGLDHDKLATVCKDCGDPTQVADICYTSFIFPLINAVKELSQKNNDLEAKMSAVLDRLDKLEKK